LYVVSKVTREVGTLSTDLFVPLKVLPVDKYRSSYVTADFKEKLALMKY
jgi:hypothetical protein